MNWNNRTTFVDETVKIADRKRRILVINVEDINTRRPSVDELVRNVFGWRLLRRARRGVPPPGGGPERVAEKRARLEMDGNTEFRGQILGKVWVTSDEETNTIFDIIT